jgi:hypothetical protein
MTGRIVNVRPKPGFLMDGAGDIIPTRQNVVQFQRDRLTNIMSGMGTTADKRVGMFYSFAPMSPDQAEAGYRSSWLVRNGQQLKLHPSRVVPFIGQKVPEGGFYSSASWFWGDPIMQSIGEAVKNADLAQSGFASLIDRAAVDVFKFKDLMSTVGTQEGEDRITRRVAWTSQAKSNYRSMLLDAEDEWAQVQITWAGMTDVMMAFLNVVAGAADIPVTRLLGQSPKGLQSNGDGEERDYNKMIKAQQTEVLRPALDQIDELLIPSALGSAKSDVYYEFAPLDQLDEKDAATVEKQAADTIKVYADAGIIPDVALSEMAKNRIVESGRWPGSEKAFEDAEAAIAADPRLDPLNPDNQEPVVDPNAEAGVPAIEKVPPKPRKPRSPGQ